MYTSTLLTVLAAATSLVAAAPAPAATTSAAPKPTSEPATVHFTPYKEVGCRQDQNPYSTAKPDTYNVTSGHCITSTYSFNSLVETGNNLAANGPCSFSLFPQASCKGSAVNMPITNYTMCKTDSSSSGVSFRMDCGP